MREREIKLHRIESSSEVLRCYNCRHIDFIEEDGWVMPLCNLDQELTDPYEVCKSFEAEIKD